MQILYCNVHICTQKGIGVDKDKTTTEETKSIKRCGGWGMECRRTHEDMEAEKRRSGETIVEQRGGEWGRESHVLFETVIIMSYIYMLIHRRKIKSSVGGRIQRDTCFYLFFFLINC